MSGTTVYVVCGQICIKFQSSTLTQPQFMQVGNRKADKERCQRQEIKDAHSTGPFSVTRSVPTNLRWCQKLFQNTVLIASKLLNLYSRNVKV